MEYFLASIPETFTTKLAEKLDCPCVDSFMRYLVAHLRELLRAIRTNILLFKMNQFVLVQSTFGAEVLRTIIALPRSDIWMMSHVVSVKRATGGKTYFLAIA